LASADARFYYCSAQGNRKAAAAAILTEECATISHFKAIFGWTKLESTKAYVRKADIRRQSRGRLMLMRTEQTESKSSHFRAAPDLV